MLETLSQISTFYRQEKLAFFKPVFPIPGLQIAHGELYIVIFYSICKILNLHYSLRNIDIPAVKLIRQIGANEHGFLAKL